jgi:hypothetical protein
MIMKKIITAVCCFCLCNILAMEKVSPGENQSNSHVGGPTEESLLLKRTIKGKTILFDDVDSEEEGPGGSGPKVKRPLKIIKETLRDSTPNSVRRLGRIFFAVNMMRDGHYYCPNSRTHKKRIAMLVSSKRAELKNNTHIYQCSECSRHYVELI